MKWLQRYLRRRSDAAGERDKTGTAATPADGQKPYQLAPELGSEIGAWYRGKEFAYDWTSNNFPIWTAVLGPRERRRRILEVGSYEGRSAIFFLNYFAESTMVCIDWWNPDTMDMDIAKHVPGQIEEFTFAESRFDRNLAPFGSRMTKVKADSSVALADLCVTDSRFDLIYVDGCHKRSFAYRDCLLSWPLLDAGGVMIIDDYEFTMPDLPESGRPKQGVDAFLRTIAGDYQELHRGYQIIISRLR